MRPAACILASLLTLGCTGALSDADAGEASGDAASPSRDASVRRDAGGGDEDAGPTADAGPTVDDAGLDAGTDAGLDMRPSSARHVQHPLGSTSAPLGFWEYLPPTYERGPSPLLLFLHGRGENGNGTTDLPMVLRAGPPRLIDRDEWPNDRPFVVLSPQNSSASDCMEPAAIRGMLAYALAHYDIDVTRVYLTGLSCGAIGGWGYLANYLADDTLAAFVPIAGNGTWAWMRQGCELGRLPIWAFHGMRDMTVWPSGTIDVMTDIMACTDPAPVDAQMTIYDDAFHDAWTRTYDLSAGHDIYAWMLSHTNP